MRSQLLRTALTVSIIAVGIMALVVMITATEVMAVKIEEEFSSIGTNSFTVKTRSRFGRRAGQSEKPQAPISYQEAKRFKEAYTYDGTVSLSAFGSATAIAKKGNQKTDPNVQVLGIDENYFGISG
ncbi:MAG: ABC transporter permease, partial [Flavobacteriales bacterium]|nr:ABC transporter permease [Flavobacteriales bacterium]